MKLSQLSFLSFIILMISYSGISAQNNYMGETPPDEEPVKFAIQSISRPTTGEYSISISPDEQTILFSRFDMNNGTNTTWYTTCINEKWTAPKIASFAQNTYSVEAFFSPVGNQVIFISDRDHNASSPDFSPQIYTTSLSDGVWSDPEPLAGPFSSQKKMGASIAANGNIYFSQKDENNVTFHIYYSTFINGIYQEPHRLDGWVNEFPQSGHCYIAPNESYLIFDAASNYPDNWNTHIFISFRNTDGSWGRPTKLNSQINSGDVNYMPYISPDQQFLFFCRQGDLYWADATKILRTSGISELFKPQKDEIRSIFPNPASKILSVELDQRISNRIHMQILNPLGQVLFNKYLETGFSESRLLLQMDIGFLKPGQYWIRAITQNSIQSIEAFIKH